MSINEIEVHSTSISFQVLTFKADDLNAVFSEITTPEETFSIDPETPGFHDCEFKNDIIRGYYSLSVSFEVEHLVEGITTKTLLKRIESCEFWAVEGVLFATGKPNAIKNLARAMTPIIGFGVTNPELDFHQMSDFHNRLSDVKSVVVTNPKDREVRRATLAGRIEDYTEFNILDARNHGLEKVSGIFDTPLGPITVAPGKKGLIRFGVKKGFVLSIDCLYWVWTGIQNGKPQELQMTIKKDAESFVGRDGIKSASLAFAGKTVTMTAEQATKRNEREVEEPNPYHGNDQEDGGE